MRRMQLSLVLPGLLWPQKALHDTTYDLDLPALAWLLGRGRLEWSPPLPLESCLCDAFGIPGSDAADAPCAALRMLGEGVAPDTALWLCADPAHLRFEQTTLVLGETGALTTEPAEITELATLLAPVLAEFGTLRVMPSGFAYLELKAPAAIMTTPPSAAIGRRADTVDGRGPEAMRWRRLANEVQMLLHDHPLNQRRNAAGQSVINSLWFWGGGTLPLQRPCPWDAAWGNGRLLTGLAAWGEIDWAPAAQQFADLPNGHDNVLATIDTLLQPTQQLDAYAWRAALLQLEQDWLAPALHALRNSQLQSLTLIGLGDEARVELTVTPSDRFRFWRKPMPLANLPIPAA
jgi:hypothetical protein